MLCPYAKCRYIECHILFIVMLNVIMLSVVMLGVMAPKFKTNGHIIAYLLHPGSTVGATILSLTTFSIMTLSVTI
jgi:hypothetical protein